MPSSALMRRLRGGPAVAIRSSRHRLAVQANVQTITLDLFGDPETDNGIDELEQDEGDDRAIGDRGDHAIDLGYHLTALTIDQADRIGRAGHRRGGKHAGPNRADEAAAAMHTEGG